MKPQPCHATKKDHKNFRHIMKVKDKSRNDNQPKAKQTNLTKTAIGWSIFCKVK